MKEGRLTLSPSAAPLSERLGEPREKKDFRGEPGCFATGEFAGVSTSSLRNLAWDGAPSSAACALACNARTEHAERALLLRAHSFQSRADQVWQMLVLRQEKPSVFMQRQLNCSA